MIESVVAFIVLVAAIAVLCAAVWILARGAISWSDAVAAQHRARAHGIEADMQRETIEHARATADQVLGGGRPPPNADQIRDALLRQRAASNGQLYDEYEEVTTSGDVTPDELNEHMQGGEFREPVT